MGYRLAVDLGTAFSAAAIVNGSDPVMVGLGNRTMQIPSVLFIAGGDSFVVGEAAERRGVTEPDRLVREFKRRFGDPVPLLIAGAAYSPESLMARLLRWVVTATTTNQGEVPAELMLTHPANWGPYKRELLDQVVALAELSRARYCTEPAAAAVKYAARTKVEIGDRIAVYDLGGGTFDVCVLEKRGDGFGVLGTPAGIEHLGGADIDEAVTQLVMRSLAPRLERADLDDPAMTVGLARLRRDCVEAKEALSTETDVAIPVALPGVSTTVRINRAELETAVRPALLDTIAALRRTLDSAKVDATQLKAIVLVGGSSRIPLVGELLQSAFKVPLSIDTHPKHDVALGAALLCRGSAAGFASPPRRESTSRDTETPVAGSVGRSEIDSRHSRMAPGSATAKPVSAESDLYSDQDYLAAVAAGFAEQWAVAANALERVAGRHPGHRRVVERLEKARRQLRISALTAQAAGVESDGTWLEAAAVLEELADLQPDDQDVARRLDVAKTRARADELVEEMRSLNTAGHWDAVLRTADELRGLAAERVPEAMEAGARRELVQAELEVKYGDALRELDEENWTVAATMLAAVVAKEAGYRDAQALLERAQTQVRLIELYGAAEEAELVGRRDLARERWQAIVAQQPSYRDAPDRLAALGPVPEPEPEPRVAEPPRPGIARHPGSPIARPRPNSLRRSPRRRPIPEDVLTRRILLAVFAGLFILSVIAAWIPDGGTPTPITTSPAAYPTWSPSPSALTPAPIAATEELIARIPAEQDCIEREESVEELKELKGLALLDCLDGRYRIVYRAFRSKSDLDQAAGVFCVDRPHRNDCRIESGGPGSAYEIEAKDGSIIAAGRWSCFTTSANVHPTRSWTEDSLHVLAAVWSTKKTTCEMLADWWQLNHYPAR